eukprot:15448589-Alexandrium_andersonii.AAC.1
MSRHYRKTALQRIDDEPDSKADFELFVTQMSTKRGWSMERAHAEWTRMEALPESIIGRDWGGPSHSKLRLHIPANLMGEGK